jgi:integrase/recombinase XerD
MIQADDLVQFLRTKGRLRAGTIVTRKSRILIFIRWLQNKPITPLLVEEFFSYLQDTKKLSNTSLNTYIAALRSLELYLVDRQLAKPFMTGFKNYTQQEADVVPLSVLEVQALKRGFVHLRNKKLAQTYYDLTVFLFDTGSRWEDARAFKAKGINLAGQEVSFLQLKTGKRKTVFITDPLLSIMKRRSSTDPDTLVFPNSIGKMLHYPDYYKYLKKLAHSVGITKRVSPHIPRHSYGQSAYDQTRDILLTSNMLGHKNISSTMRYAKNSQEQIREAQQIHPHLEQDPKVRIRIIENSLNSHKLDQHRNFNSLKIKKAQNAFIEALYEAIEDKNLS